MPASRTGRQATTYRLSSIIDAFASAYGEQQPFTRDAFELVVWEKAAYLATDDKRRAAFELLRRSVGLTPTQILRAKRSALVDILATGGINATERAENLIAAAELAVGDFDGNLENACKLALRDAKRALCRIRGIADPGAEKILLFTGHHPVLGVESNGLRVLTRLGYGADSKSYSSTYRSATTAALAELGDDIQTLTRANLLLREHGMRVCKTSSPKCGECVVRAQCPSARNYGASGSAPRAQKLPRSRPRHPR